MKGSIKKGRPNSSVLPLKYCGGGDLDVGKGLPQTDHAVAFFPGSTLFQQFNALEALEDVTFDDEAAGTLEALMLGHGVIGESVTSDALKGKGARVRFGP